MRGKMDELIERFHSLQSNNLQETKRNFNELIDVIRRDIPLQADVDTLITSIQPKTKLESILKVEMLIRFKRYDDLLEILKGGNPILIAKVLKCWKLFEVFFNKIDSQTLVGQIFPQTSFSTRTKIITKLSTNLRNEELADEYFNAIEDKYGFSVAKGMLPACSLDLIKSAVATYKLTLTSRQLLTIVKRNRVFLGYYFEVKREAHGKDFDFSWKYPQVLKYLAKVDEQVFWELFEKYQLISKFGRHMTTKLYESGKDVVTASQDKLKLFNVRKLYKVVGKSEDDFCSFILQLFPKNVNSFPYEYSSCRLKTLIEFFPRHKRYEVLNYYFEKAYGESIHELLSLKTPQDIMEIMPVEEREAILDKKVSSDENVFYMYSPAKSIPLLQERIRLTSSIHKRSHLLVQLSKTCRLSGDTEALLEVLQYVRSRHRNDNIALSDFMINLQKWPHLEKLTGEHWTYINELLSICKRMSNYRLYSCDIHFMGKYLIYLVENGLSYEEFMKSLLLHLKEKNGSLDVFSNQKLPKWEKMCHEHFARLLPELCTKEELETWSGVLLEAIVNYNKRNPRDRIVISQYPFLVETVKSRVTRDSFFNATLFYYLKFEDEVLGDQVFWENYEKVCNADMIIWYLQKRPNKILEHLDKILTPRIIQLFRYELNEILNLVSFLPSISEKIVDFSLKALQDDDVAVSKFAATSLSYLTTKEEYFKAARPFVPVAEDKVDFKNVKENFVFTLQAIVDGLANLDDPASCLPILLEFCVGDYMKYTCKSLHQVTSHTPESKLGFFLNSLYKSAVSVRKHAVSITSRFFPKSAVHTFLKDSGQNDKHPSLRKSIFKHTLGYFIANPSDEFWGLLKDNVKIIEEKDRETLVCLVNLRKIPGKYLSDYFSMAYTLLSTNKEKEIQAMKYTLLSSLRNELVDEINVNYLIAVIKDTFPKDIYKTNFYLMCLFHTTGSNNAFVLDSVFEILKNYVEKNYTINKTRKDLHNIIQGICSTAVRFKLGKSLIVKFIEFLTSAVKAGKLLEEYLVLQLANAFLDFHSEDNPRKFGVNVSEILREWIGLHGSSAISIFTERLSKVVALDEKKQFEFVDGLLQASDTDFNYIVTLNFLFDRVQWKDIKDTYGSVLTKIKDHKSSAVQVYLQRQLRNVPDEIINLSTSSH